MYEAFDIAPVTFLTAFRARAKHGDASGDVTHE